MYLPLDILSLESKQNIFETEHQLELCKLNNIKKNINLLLFVLSVVKQFKIQARLIKVA